MDAFYASVELLRYPDLRGTPVVIGGGRDAAPVLNADGTRRYALLRHYTGRGVITTATYEARALGAHSGMGIMKAALLAPQAVLLPVDFEAYRKYSRLFKAAARSVAPVLEDRGIDEIYLDLTDLPGAQLDAGRALGMALKDAVRNATGLTCSVGVTPNKLLSKICSDLDKPDGLTLLSRDEIAVRIWPLAAKKINGIGPKATEKLASFGIHSIGDLAAADPMFLVAQFGKSQGAWLHEAAHGRDERPVVTFSEPKSISRETTFERDLHAVRDRAALTAIFTDLCVKLAGDLARKGYASKTIGIKLRFDDFKSVTRDLTLLSESEIRARIWPLPAKKINGIGPKATAKLAGFHIHTIGDLAAAEPQFLRGHFGKSYAAWLHEAAHGRDIRPVVTHSEPKSISRETTFERDLHAVRDRAALTPIFTDLCVKLAGDLARKGYASKTIGIKLRFDDFKIVTRDLTLPAHTMDAKEIRQAAGACLKRVDLSRRLRLLGVRAGALVRLADVPEVVAQLASLEQELSLFEGLASRDDSPAAHRSG